METEGTAGSSVVEQSDGFSFARLGRGSKIGRGRIDPGSTVLVRGPDAPRGTAMTRLNRVASALLLSGTIAPLATAQTPPPRYNVQRPANPQVTPPRQAPAATRATAAQSPSQSQARR